MLFLKYLLCVDVCAHARICGGGGQCVCFGFSLFFCSKVKGLEERKMHLHV